MQRRNKMTIGIVLVVVLLIGGVVVLGNRGNSPEKDVVSTQSQPDNSSMAEEVTDDTQPVDTSQPADSRYVEYSEGVLEEHMDKRRVLYYYASWCPTCRPLDADLRSQSDRIPEDVVIIRVNYNDPDTDEGEKALAEEYGVTYQHTFVEIDAEGNEVQKWNGGQVDSVISRLE